MPRADDRRVLSGVVHALKSGGRWGDCPEHVYDSNALRFWLAERGTTPVIPSKSNRKVQIEHDRAIYRQRDVIERMVCRFKDWRRVATRFDRNIKTFMATIAIAALVTWRD